MTSSTLCSVKVACGRYRLIDFVTYTKPDYQVNWHHKQLCETLDKVVRGDITRLMVCMPPQHGKSELVSRRLPAQLLGINPNCKIIIASYGSTLSSSFNRDCQRIIDSDRYHRVFPNTYLNKSVYAPRSSNYLRNSHVFETVGHSGYVKTVSIGGALTGTTADIAIIDDPVKDSIEATSYSSKQKTWDWYNNVLLPRLNNKSKIILCMTRWAPDDLAGRILEHEADKWTVLTLPAIKETDDNINDPRQIGEALWEEQHSLEKLRAVQQRSLRTFVALYQQQPSPTQTGGEFYRSFSTNKHVKQVTYNPALPLHISFDFNVNPYITCTVWQIDGKKAMQINELCQPHPRNTSAAVCSTLLAMYNNHRSGLYIYGDPQGLKQSTTAAATVRNTYNDYNEYAIISKALAAFNPVQRVVRAYPHVKPRGDFINAILENNYQNIEITIDEKCVHSINDLLYVKENSDGGKLKEKAKDANSGATYEKYGHTSDSMDYMMCAAFKNEFYLFQHGAPRQMPYAFGKRVSRNGY